MPQGFSVQVRVLPPFNIRHCGKRLNPILQNPLVQNPNSSGRWRNLLAPSPPHYHLCPAYHWQGDKRIIWRGVVSPAGSAVFRIDRGRYFRQLQQFRQLVRICVFRSYQCIICPGQSYLNLIAAGKVGNNILGARPVCQCQDKIIIPCPADR